MRNGAGRRCRGWQVFYHKAWTLRRNRTLEARVLSRRHPYEGGGIVSHRDGKQLYG